MTGDLGAFEVEHQQGVERPYQRRVLPPELLVRAIETGQVHISVAWRVSPSLDSDPWKSEVESRSWGKSGEDSRDVSRTSFRQYGQG